jgi:LmbE family N-acetylglucosaminyl deacetylase
MTAEREATTTALLAILAHPDDESFAMGGTLARYAAAGAVVRLIYATRGEAGIPGLSQEAAGQVRQAELSQAVSVLGVREVRFLDYQDGTLAQGEPAVAIERLAAILDELRPRAVITFGPDGISGHPDHVTVGAWVTAAFDRAGAVGWGARLFYIAPSEATQQGCGVPPEAQAVGGPVAFVDVGPYLATKVRAAQCHASQSPPFRGDPAQEASRLACHEVFRLARPIVAPVDRVFADLLEDEMPGWHSRTQ